MIWKSQLLLKSTLKTLRPPIRLGGAAFALAVGSAAFLAGCSAGARFGGKEMTYSDSIFVTMTFIEHVGDKPMQSYLTQNIHFPPVDRLRGDLEGKLGVSLKNRGEAHITVVTPVEYDKVLAPRLSMRKINEIARQAGIQSIPFEPLCIGAGQLKIDGRDEQAYFIVVNAPKLVELRRTVQQAFVAAGGDGTTFVPENFFPHITLGFTKRDLHAEDGVIKDSRSCLYRLEREKR